MENQNEQLDDQLQNQGNSNPGQTNEPGNNKSNLIPDEKIEGNDDDTDSSLEMEEEDEEQEDDLENGQENEVPDREKNTDDSL